MSIDVIIPWSGNCVYRASALSYVRSLWSSCGFNVVVGEIDGPWSKARAVASALERSHADTLVITDGDVWSEAAPASAHLVDAGEVTWAVPFSTVRRLNEAATADVIAGGPLGGRLVKQPFRAVPGGGLVVLRRELYERAPLDPRFVGWNYEDIAWGQALTMFAGRPMVSSSPLWHLWHPPAFRGPSPERRAGAALRVRYAKARRNPEQMQMLMDEAKDSLATPTPSGPTTDV